MEVQNGIVGEGGMLPALLEEVGGAARSTPSAVCVTRHAPPGARVVHCTAVARPDGAGSTDNCKIFALAARQRREHGARRRPISARPAPS